VLQASPAAGNPPGGHHNLSRHRRFPLAQPRIEMAHIEIAQQRRRRNRICAYLQSALLACICTGLLAATAQGTVETKTNPPVRAAETSSKLLQWPSTFDVILAGGTLSDEELLSPPVFIDPLPGELPSPDPTPEAMKPPPASPAPEKLLARWSHTLPPPLQFWSGRLEFGLNGTDGNSEQMSSHSVGKVCRKTPEEEITLNLTHDFAQSKSDATANQLIYDGRYEYLFQESPWTAFVHDTLEYDQFAAFDSRVGFDGGMGYRFMDHERTKLKGRAGAGASREYGVPESEYVLEATFTGEFEHKFWERHKVTAKTEWFPEMEEWGEYRAKHEAGWETKLDARHPLSLKLSLIDRYDSSPNGGKHNDLQYSALVVWEF
jgi:putative salt-induced outer membrane protein YdiY